MTQNYVVVKPTKSVGIAVILTLLLGPIGLFYASVTGGMIMLVLPLVLAVVASLMGFGLAVFYGSMLYIIIYFLFGWFVCLVWAIIAVNNYNRRLIMNSVVSLPSTDYPDYGPQSNISKDFSSRGTTTHKTHAFLIISIFVSLLVGSFIIWQYKKSNDNKTPITSTYEWSTRTNTYLYSRPDINSYVIGKVSSGSNFNTIKRTKYFIQVQFTDGNGSTHRGYLKKTDLITL